MHLPAVQSGRRPQAAPGLGYGLRLAAVAVAVGVLDVGAADPAAGAAAGDGAQVNPALAGELACSFLAA